MNLDKRKLRVTEAIVGDECLIILTAKTFMTIFHPICYFFSNIRSWKDLSYRFGKDCFGFQPLKIVIIQELLKFTCGFRTFFIS